MNGVIEAKPAGSAVMRSGVGGGDQASALRALVGGSGVGLVSRSAAKPSQRASGVVRIAWLTDREYPHERAAITALSASIGQREGVRVAWERVPDWESENEDTVGLLMVCDSCRAAAEALRRVRWSVASRAWPAPRTAASSAWIGAIGLAGDAAGHRVLSAALRGMRETVERMMDEPVALLGVQRCSRRRGTLLSRRAARVLSDESRQGIENFLVSRARGTCAIH